ncbi:MAG: hypothetical protein QOJ03_2083 [Frankiaceae bacterium]|nr:hypothetical protein [Frankiaceae bacterium]
MRLEGSIDAFSLPDIFSLLSMTKKTGGLHLRRDSAHGVVWFTTGALTGGASDVSRQSLARRVIGAGLVGDEELQTAIDRAVADEIGVGRALQQGASIDEGALHDLASEHIVDTVFDLLRWPEGDFAFVVDEANPDDVGVSRQVDEVVTEARRRLDVWGDVAATVPSPQTTLSLAPNPADDPQISRDEWALLALVDGRRTVGDIVGMCGRGDFTVVSALADLVGRGLLRADDADGLAAVTRRHDLLAKVERGTAAVPEQTTAPVEPAPDVTEPEARRPAKAPTQSDADAATDEPVAKPLASVPDGPRTPAPRTEVTPKRPEPFLPKRQPEHPEEPVAMPVAAAGGAGAAPAPATSIERDPSVNKSLLLRLIAGVRGL